MSYQVPPNIKNNKIFIINRSEIEGRLDPKMSLYNRKVQRFAFPCVKFKALLLKSPQYGANEAGVPRIKIDEPRYIRITDIDESGLISNTELGVTASNIEDKYILYENDILIARSGATVGKTYIHKNLPYKCFFAGYLIRFVVNPQMIIPDYVFIFTQLNIYKEWVNAIQRPSAQPNINAEEYQALEIPLPEISIQNEIVERVSDAYKLKREKEQQSESLLQSIDDYLQNVLGIQQSEINDNNAKAQYFIVNKNSLKDRLDPIFYDADIKRYTQCTYSDRLSNLALSFIPGFAVGRQDQVEHDNGILQIRPTNIDNNGRLKFEKNVYVPEVANMPFVKSGAVLFNNTNSQEWVGKTTYFANEENKKVYTSNHITAITVDRTKILPEYLCAILNMYQRHKVFYSICTNWNNQSGVGLDLLKSIHIPLFTDDRKESLRKQQEIVDYITAVYQQAKALQEEGKAILEQAKKEVEQMILGN